MRGNITTSTKRKYGKRQKKGEKDKEPKKIYIGCAEKIRFIVVEGVLIARRGKRFLEENHKIRSIKAVVIAFNNGIYTAEYAMKKIGKIINSDGRKEYDGAFLCELDKESET